jgi:hypothetical protein
MGLVSKSSATADLEEVDLETKPLRDRLEMTDSAPHHDSNNSRNSLRMYCLAVCGRSLL